jgi:flagellin
MAVINTNVKALYTQHALKGSARAQTVAMEQLSTGKRINSARDDAAGMAIAKRMSQQIRSLDMAIRNAGDAVALIQTAEGATGTITDMLQRMRELAIQAMNDTNAQDQRGYLDLEFQQLKQQIVTIADHTQWNGFSILNGTVGERVGDRPVYKVTSSGVDAENITFTRGTPTTSVAANQVAASGSGVFTKAGQLQVTFGGDTTAITSATFTLPDGNVVNLDVANTNVIAFTGNVITLKSASGLVSGDVTLTQTVAVGGAVANYASGNTIGLNVTRTMPTVTAMQANDIIINGITIPASSALSDKVSVGGSVAASAISRAAAINQMTDDTGVMAVVNVNTMTGSAMVGGDAVTGTISINGFTTPQVTTVLNNLRESRALVVEAINTISAQTGVVAINTGNDAEGIRLEARDGRNIEVAFNSAVADATFAQRTGIRQGLQIGSYSLESTVEGPVVVTTTPTTDWTRAGLRPGDYSQNISTYTTEVRPVVTAVGGIESLGDGDLVINGIAIRGARAIDDSVSSTVAATSSRIASAIATAVAINESSSLTGVTATALAASTTSTSAPTTTASGSANIFINGVAVNVTLVANESPTDRLTKIINAVNAQRGQHGVQAEAKDGRLTLSTPDGRNLSVWFNSSSALTLGQGATVQSELGLAGSAATAIANATAASTGAATVYGSIALSSEKAFTLAPGINGFNSDGDFTTLGFQQGTFGGNVNEADSKMSPPRTGRLTFHVGASATQTIHIDFADYGAKGPITGEITGDVENWNKDSRINRIDNAESARAMLAKLDSALDKVNGNRAVMGAVMNRLDYIMENLSNVSMNTSASRSQIEDADYAKASTELARTQIMQQAATAVLAQANMDQQTVLKLLQ